MKQNEEMLANLYLKMHQARLFEKKIEGLFFKNTFHGTTHLAIGQEASSVASAMALEEGDLAFLTYRGHAAAIGLGGDIKKMMAEMQGKVTGSCKGKGGSMHIADFASGNMGSNGVVSGGYPLACGAAFTQKYKKTGKVVMSYGGDGSTNAGNFHEALNLAALWKLPIVFFIENNGYALSTPAYKHMPIENVIDRMDGYGIPGLLIDGNDAIEVFETTKKAIAYAREGNGPMLIEAKTYRYSGHSKSDVQIYRDQEEVEEWQEYDPLDNLEIYLSENEILSQTALQQIEEHAYQSIEEAWEYAVTSPEPELMSIFDDVYATQGEDNGN